MKKILLPALILIIAIVVVLIIVLNFSKTPILVGVVGTYSGKNSDFGISVRNGILMAFDEVNAEGGIDGYVIETIVADDKNDPDKIKQEVSNLIQKDVTVILGPVTSGMAAEILGIVNENETLMLGPTISSDVFTGIDDYLLRTVRPSKILGSIYADFLINNTEIEKVLAFYDETNKEYCLGIINEFDLVFSENDDVYELVDNIAFDTNNVDFDYLVEKVKEYNPDAILFVANADDVATFAQHIKKAGINTQLITGGWAKQTKLIEKGGSAIEGLLIGTNFDNSIQDPNFIEFKERYYEKYNKVPEPGSAYGYEAASIVIDTLKSNKSVNRENIKESILEIGKFQGLVGNIEFNEFGDADRPLYMLSIEDGQFKTIE